MPPLSKQDEVNVPLATAIKEGDLATAEKLIKAGADVDSYMDGATPLFFAAVLNDKAMARMLVAHGADTANALSTAVCFNDYPHQIRTVDRLLEVGADPYFDEGDSADATHTNLETAANSSSMPVLEFIISKIHAPRSDREARVLRNSLTIGLDRACKLGDSVAVEFLLRRLPDLPANDAAGARRDCLNHELLMACHAADLRRAELLIARGADVNFEWMNGEYYPLEGNRAAETPLSAASGAGALSVMRYLLAHGACVNAAKIGKDNPPINAAIASLSSANRMAAVGLLLEHGASVNVANAVGETPLMYAAFDNPSRVATLLSHGARVNTQDKLGRTALFRACTFQQLSVAKMLIAHGASSNICGDGGSCYGIASPLEMASFRSVNGVKCDPNIRRSLIKLLLNHGANPRHKDASGFTYKDVFNIDWSSTAS
jgi:ankyrin repeat protein